MKQTTFDKYVDFLRYSYTASGIYDLNLASRHYKVADSFISFLKKNKYLERMAGGSYKLIDCPLGFGHIVSEYKKATERKQPNPEPAGFAYPISVRCEKTDDREKCIKLLESVGYKNEDYTFCENVVNNYQKIMGNVGTANGASEYKDTRYHIDHFDADLIRDIASVRTGDVWVKGEPFVNKHTGVWGYGGIISSAGEKIEGHYNWLRPTIAEICDHYGYELNGMNIVKKSEPKPYPAPVKLTPLEEHEADVIKLLKEIEADHGVSYELTRIETRKIKLL